MFERAEALAAALTRDLEWCAMLHAVMARELEAAEALALRIQNRDSAFIRVKNSEGETIVRAGVTTALASIERCSCAACPVKREWERRVSAGA
jgi:hypothetical protein